MNSSPRSWRLSRANPVEVPGAVGDHRPTDPAGNCAYPRFPALVMLMNQCGASRLGEQHRPQANQPSRRCNHRDDGAAGVTGTQIGYGPPSRRYSLGHGSDVF